MQNSRKSRKSLPQVFGASLPLHSNEASLRPTVMQLDNVTLQGLPRISFDDQVVWPAWGNQNCSTLLHTPKKTFGSLFPCRCCISSSTGSLFKTAVNIITPPIFCNTVALSTSPAVACHANAQRGVEAKASLCAKSLVSVVAVSAYF